MKKLSWLRYGFEELKFLKSLHDVKLLYDQKLPFFLTRLTGYPIRDTEVPPSLQLEPTNHCILNCICCARDKVKREKGYMGFDLFQKIIDDASDTGVRRIHLYLHGEPLLHPQIIEMIRCIKAKNIGITMATNGMLLDREMAQGMLESGMNSSDYVVFSVLGHSKEVHETVMRGVEHDRVIENIFCFLEVRKRLNRNGPVVGTVFYQMPENEHETMEFQRYWRPIVDHVHPVESISRQFADFQSGNGPLPPRRKTCRNLWERMTIFWNGDVTLCIADLEGDMAVGNVKDHTIKDLWNCEDLRRIRDLHKRKKFSELELCSDCDW